MSLLVFSGCVTTTPPARLAGPNATIIRGVPAEKYGVRECAAGALAAVLTYWGDPVRAHELDERLPKVRHGGVLTVDMLIEARSRGYEAELMEGTPSLIADSIARGEPLILLVRVMNAPRSRADLYHYIVADGHDRELGLVRLHFGDGVRRWAELERLERSWAPTDHLVLRVRPEVDHQRHGSSLLP